jgi:hypothetical protein
MWTDGAIRDDLSVYKDVNPEEAMEARDLLLSWLKVDG